MTVGQLEETMSIAEFDEWMEYQEIDPIPSNWEQWRFVMAGLTHTSVDEWKFKVDKAKDVETIRNAFLSISVPSS